MKKTITPQSIKSFVDSDEVHSNVIQVLESFLNKGFIVKFDLEESEGTAQRLGQKIEFNVGGENLYFSISGYTKCAVDETIDFLDSYTRIASNFS